MLPFNESAEFLFVDPSALRDNPPLPSTLSAQFRKLEIPLVELRDVGLCVAQHVITAKPRLVRITKGGGIFVCVDERVSLSRDLRTVADVIPVVLVSLHGGGGEEGHPANQRGNPIEIIDLVDHTSVALVWEPITATTTTDGANVSSATLSSQSLASRMLLFRFATRKVALHFLDTVTRFRAHRPPPPPLPQVGLTPPSDPSQPMNVDASASHYVDSPQQLQITNATTSDVGHMRQLLSEDDDVLDKQIAWDAKQRAKNGAFGSLGRTGAVHSQSDDVTSQLIADSLPEESVEIAKRMIEKAVALRTPLKSPFPIAAMSHVVNSAATVTATQPNTSPGRSSNAADPFLESDDDDFQRDADEDADDSDTNDIIVGGTGFVQQHSGRKSTVVRDALPVLEALGSRRPEYFTASELQDFFQQCHLFYSEENRKIRESVTASSVSLHTSITNLRHVTEHRVVQTLNEWRVRRKQSEGALDQHLMDLQQYLWQLQAAVKAAEAAAASEEQVESESERSPSRSQKNSSLANPLQFYGTPSSLRTRHSMFRQLHEEIRRCEARLQQMPVD